MPPDVGQGCPVIRARGARLDEGEVPVLLGVPGDPVGQLRPSGRDADRSRQPLVAEIRDLRIQEVLAGRRAGDRREQVGVDGVDEGDPVRSIGIQRELPDGGRGQVGRHGFAGAPAPGGLAVVGARAAQRAV